jgi:hypothetical protein
MAFDGLDVSIGAATADFKKGISSVNSSIRDLVENMGLAERTLDEAGDEATELAAAFQATQSAIDEAGDESAFATTQVESLRQVLDQLDDEVIQNTAGLQALESQLRDMTGEATKTSVPTAVLQSIIDELGDEAVLAALGVKSLEEATEEAGDEMTKTGVKAAGLAASFSGLAAAASSARISFGSISIVMLASLIPAFLTLATVIAPVVALFFVMAGGLAGIAAGVAAVVGAGFIAWGDKLAQQNQENLEQTDKWIKKLENMKERRGELSDANQRWLDSLKERKKKLEEETTIFGALTGEMSNMKDELLDVIIPFGQEFIPLIEEGVGALPKLLENIIDALGPMDEFKEFVRDLGAAGMKNIPALIGFMVDMGRSALPVLRDFMAFWRENGPAAMEAMQESVEELRPHWEDLLDALIDFGPTLLEFGTVAAKVVIPALTMLIRAMDGWMEFMTQFDDETSKALVALHLLLPIFLLIAKVASVVLTALGFQGLTGAILRLAGGAVRLGSWLARLAPALSTVAAYAKVVAGALASIWTVAVIIGAAIGLAVVKLMSMVGAFEHIRNAGESFGEFLGGDLTETLLALMGIFSLGLIPLLAATGAAIVKLVQGDLSGAVEAFKQVLGIFGKSIKGFFQGIWEWIAGLIDKYIGSSIIPDMIKQGLLNILGLFTGFVGRIPSILRGALEAFKSFFTGIIKLAKSWKSRFVQVMLKAIRNVIQKMTSSLQQGINELPGVSGVDLNAGSVTSMLDQGIAGARQTADRLQGEGMAAMQQASKETQINIDSIVADSKEGGREAASALERELNSLNVSDTGI